MLKQILHIKYIKKSKSVNKYNDLTSTYRLCNHVRAPNQGELLNYCAKLQQLVKN